MITGDASLRTRTAQQVITWARIPRVHFVGFIKITSEELKFHSRCTMSLRPYRCAGNLRDNSYMGTRPFNRVLSAPNQLSPITVADDTALGTLTLSPDSPETLRVYTHTSAQITRMAVWLAHTAVWLAGTTMNNYKHKSRFMLTRLRVTNTIHESCSHARLTLANRAGPHDTCM